MTEHKNAVADSRGEIVIYQSPDGSTKIDVKFESETVWLTQAQMSELFQTSRTNIVEHIKHIYEEGELDREATCRKFRQVRKEGLRNVTREIPYYNLDMIISLGYRVKSLIATQFRRWATERLKEYLIKGFTMDDYVEHLDNILASTGEKVLSGAGSVSHKQAMDKAVAEYRKYQVKTLSSVEKDYLQTIKTLEAAIKKQNKE